MSPTTLHMLYAVLALGAAGVYLCLPSERPGWARARLAGGVIAAAALGGLAAYLAAWIGPLFPGRALFVIFAALAIAAALRVITHPRPVYCALYFVIVVLAVTGLCVLAAAEFLAAALVIVYAGAILVTYVFVIMLAQQSGATAYDARAREPWAAVVMGFALAATTAQAMSLQNDAARAFVTPSGGAHAARGFATKADQTPAARGVAFPPVASTGENAPWVLDPASINGPQGNVRAIGQTLMTTYVVAVELAGVLLLVAVAGAIAIIQKRIEPAALTERERREHAATEDLHRAGREAAPF